MAQPNNYNDRDHNQRWEMTKQFTVSKPGIDFWGQTPGTSSMKFQVNCLAAAAFGCLAICVLRSGIRTPNPSPNPILNSNPNPNLGPRTRTRLGPQPVLGQFNWIFFFVFRIFVLADSPTSKHRSPAPPEHLLQIFQKTWLRRRFHRLIEVISNCKLIASRSAEPIHPPTG